MTNARTFDFAAMLERLQNDPEHARDLLGIFLQYEAPMLTAIVEAVEQQNAVAIEFSAHRAKGALASIHAEAASELTSQIERAAAHGDLVQATLTLPDLRNSWRELVDELAEWTRHGCQSRTHSP